MATVPPPNSDRNIIRDILARFDTLHDFANVNRNKNKFDMSVMKGKVLQALDTTELSKTKLETSFQDKSKLQNLLVRNFKNTIEVYDDTTELDTLKKGSKITMLTFVVQSSNNDVQPTKMAKLGGVKRKTPGKEDKKQDIELTEVHYEITEVVKKDYDEDGEFITAKIKNMETKKIEDGEQIIHSNYYGRYIYDGWKQFASDIDFVKSTERQKMEQQNTVNIIYLDKKLSQETIGSNVKYRGYFVDVQNKPVRLKTISNILKSSPYYAIELDYQNLILPETNYNKYIQEGWRFANDNCCWKLIPDFVYFQNMKEGDQIIHFSDAHKPLKTITVQSVSSPDADDNFVVKDNNGLNHKLHANNFKQFSTARKRGKKAGPDSSAGEQCKTYWRLKKKFAITNKQKYEDVMVQDVLKIWYQVDGQSKLYNALVLYISDLYDDHTDGTKYFLVNLLTEDGEYTRDFKLYNDYFMVRKEAGWYYNTPEEAEKIQWEDTEEAKILKTLAKGQKVYIFWPEGSKEIFEATIENFYKPGSPRTTFNTPVISVNGFNTEVYCNLKYSDSNEYHKVPLSSLYFNQKYFKNDVCGWALKETEFEECLDSSSMRNKSSKLVMTRRNKSVNISYDFEKQAILFMEEHLGNIGYHISKLTENHSECVYVYPDTSTSKKDPKYSKVMEIYMPQNSEEKHRNIMQQLINEYFSLGSSVLSKLVYLVDTGEPIYSNRVENICTIVNDWDSATTTCASHKIDSYDIPQPEEKDDLKYVFYKFSSDLVKIKYNQNNLVEVSWNDSSGKYYPIIKSSSSTLITNAKVPHVVLSVSLLQRCIMSEMPNPNLYPCNDPPKKYMNNSDVAYALDIKRSGDALQIIRTKTLNSKSDAQQTTLDEFNEAKEQFPTKYIFVTKDQLAFLHARILKVPAILIGKDMVTLYDSHYNNLNPESAAAHGGALEQKYRTYSLSESFTEPLLQTDKLQKRNQIFKCFLNKLIMPFSSPQNVSSYLLKYITDLFTLEYYVELHPNSDALIRHIKNLESKQYQEQYKTNKSLYDQTISQASDYCRFFMRAAAISDTDQLIVDCSNFRNKRIQIMNLDFDVNNVFTNIKKEIDKQSPSFSTFPEYKGCPPNAKLNELLDNYLGYEPTSPQLLEETPVLEQFTPNKFLEESFEYVESKYETYIEYFVDIYREHYGYLKDIYTKLQLDALKKELDFIFFLHTINRPYIENHDYRYLYFIAPHTIKEYYGDLVSPAAMLSLTYIPEEPSNGDKILSLSEFVDYYMMYTNECYKWIDAEMHKRTGKDVLLATTNSINTSPSPMANPSPLKALNALHVPASQDEQNQKGLKGGAPRITLEDYHRKYYPTYAKLYYDK